MAKPRAYDLAERIAHEAVNLYNTITPDTEMYLRITATINFAFEDDHEVRDHEEHITYRLGRTGGGEILAVLHSMAGTPAIPSWGVISCARPLGTSTPRAFDPRCPAAQELMARHIMQQVFSNFSTWRVTSAQDPPSLYWAEFHATLASDAKHHTRPSTLVPGGAVWGEQSSGMLTRVSDINLVGVSDMEGGVEYEWEKRMERLNVALLHVVKTMVGGYSSMRPGIFGPAQQGYKKP